MYQGGLIYASYVASTLMFAKHLQPNLLLRFSDFSLVAAISDQN